MKHRYFRLMKYYVYRDALPPRLFRRYQRDPMKWYDLWIMRDMGYVV